MSSINKRGRGRGRVNGEGSEHDSLLQPCCIESCDRYGTRLLSSLRDNYQLKFTHSGRVCEGHYRRDLRSFKRKHINAPSRKQGRKYQAPSTEYPPQVIDEPSHHPSSYELETTYAYEEEEEETEEEEEENQVERYVPSASKSTLSITTTFDTFPAARIELETEKSREIFMEVDEYEFEGMDDEDEDDDVVIDEIISKKRNQPQFNVPTATNLFYYSDSSLLQPFGSDSYCNTTNTPFHMHCCSWGPISQSDSKFKAFCEFILQSESVI